MKVWKVRYLSNEGNVRWTEVEVDDDADESDVRWKALEEDYGYGDGISKIIDVEEM